MYDSVVMTAGGSPVVDVRPQPAGAASKSVVDLHLELFLDETKVLAQSVVECIKENGPDHSIDEVINQAYSIQTLSDSLLYWSGDRLARLSPERPIMC